MKFERNIGKIEETFGKYKTNDIDVTPIILVLLKSVVIAVHDELREVHLAKRTNTLFDP
jgi:hypothetical protein